MNNLKDVARKLLYYVLYVSPPLRCLESQAAGDKFNISSKFIYPEISVSYSLPSCPSYQTFIKGMELKLNLTKMYFDREFIVSIPRGRAYGCGTVLSPDGKYLLRDLSLDFGKTKDTHFLLQATHFKRPKRLKGLVGYAASNSGNSYYHWLLDVVPRVVNLINFGLKLDYLIVQTFAGRLQEVFESKLGRVKIIEPTLIDHYSADTLVVPSYSGLTGHPTPRSCSLILEGFDNHLDRPSSYGELIYVSRSLANYRKLLNEDKLFESLSGLGFRSIHLEKMSWQDQIAAFRQARVIVAPHGAGLSNLVFCRSGTTVFEIFYPEYVHWCFWQLCQVKELNYFPIICTSDSSNRIVHDMLKVKEDMLVDVNALTSAVRSILKEPRG